MFDGLFDKEALAYLHQVIGQLSERSSGCFMFVIPTYMEGDVEAPCGDLDSYVRVYVPDTDIRRATPPFGTLEEWMEHGVMFVAKPIGNLRIGQGAVIPISMIAEHNPSFQIEKLLCDTVRQDWYELNTLNYLRQLQTKLGE